VGKLVLFRADGTAQDIKLDRDRVTIGRRPDNDVCLPQAAVSGEHAAVVTILADSFLEDLGSTNGTLVNGKAVTKHFLRDRDEIDIGREILVYLADDSAKPAAAPQARETPGPEAADGRRSADASRPPAGATAAIGRSRRSRASRSMRSSASSPRRSRAARSRAAASAPDQAATVHDRLKTRRAVAAAHAGDPRPQRSGGGPVDSPLGERKPSIGRGRRSGGRAAPVRRRAFGCPDRGCAAARQRRAVPPDGQRLAVGDILEIAGATLELVPMSDALA
jgi:hypothetical protein